MNRFHPSFIKQLSVSDIHLWHVNLLELSQSARFCYVLLNDEEKERQANYYFEKHRRRFGAARAALRMILSGYLNVRPEEISFQFGKYGKPSVYNTNKSINFNLSHSEEYCLVGVCLDTPIGVDVEVVSKREYLELANHSFSEPECLQLASLHDEALVDGFFSIWTQKEAYIKYLARGLSYPLKQFSVSHKAPYHLHDAQREDEPDVLIDCFKPDETTYCALCVTGGDYTISHQQLTLDDT